MTEGPGRKPLTPDQIAAELIAALRAQGHEGEVVHDREKGEIVLPELGAVSVGELHANLSASTPRRRAEALAATARMLLHPPRLPETWDEVADHLLPLVQPRIGVALADLRRELGKGAPRLWLGELTPHLVVVLGWPADGGTVHVPAEALERWSVAPEEAFPRAMQNLRRRSAGSWHAGKDAPGAWVSPWQDGFDASRITLVGAMRSVPGRGRPVALIPTPNLLLVARDEDEDALFSLARLARRIVAQYESFHVLRAIRVGDDGETWEDWMPDPSHAAYGPLRLLRVFEEARDQAMFADAVRRLSSEPDRLMALPSLDILQSSFDASVLTLTRWAEGRPAALPKADRIVFERGGACLGSAPWERVVEALPGRLDPLPGYPVRHLAGDLPEPWQLGGLDLDPWEGPQPPAAGA